MPDDSAPSVRHTPFIRIPCHKYPTPGEARELARQWRQLGQLRGRNCRNVWLILTRAYSGAHFAAVYPERPVEPCIVAGTSNSQTATWNVISSTAGCRATLYSGGSSHRPLVRPWTMRITTSMCGFIQSRRSESDWSGNRPADPEGQRRTQSISDVRFVPMTGRRGE